MTVARTPLGEMKGVAFEGYERYAGIRYAEPPVGERRFRAPVPAGAWEGVYDATDFGAASVQRAVAGFSAFGGGSKVGEDCLFLNVYTPRADGGRRPVMVWIHGGAFVLGSGNLYDGGDFARTGDVVVVTLNYRLGALGWLPLDHLDESYAGSGNNGIRDQITALRWVRDNIASFGGDPGQVTIFGESAGGGSVFAILASREADGLYHRAIVQSGCPGFGGLAHAPAFVEELASHLGRGENTLEAILDATTDELLAAGEAIDSFPRFGKDPAYSLAGDGAGFHPVVDGVVIHKPVAQALADKGADNVPMIVGTNRDEGTLFTTLLPDLSDDEIEAGLATITASPRKVVDAYRACATGPKLVTDIFTETIFHIPSLNAVDAHVHAGGTSWVYLFGWRTPVFGGFLRATHALELPFVWSALDDPVWGPLVGTDPPHALSTAMRDAWIAFARAGDPNVDGLPEWPPYDATRRPTMVFDETPAVVDDPDGDLRQLWA